jgi:hypothetical protein
MGDEGQQRYSAHGHVLTAGFMLTLLTIVVEDFRAKSICATVVDVVELALVQFI